MVFKGIKGFGKYAWIDDLLGFDYFGFYLIGTCSYDCSLFSYDPFIIFTVFLDLTFCFCSYFPDLLISLATCFKLFSCC
jgi:hypothetical protein